MQRERISRADIEAFGTTAGCPGWNAIRTERLDRRREVLNEAIAKEVERNVRRREKVEVQQSWEHHRS